MSKFLEKQVFRNLLSTIIFGVTYLLLSFLDKGYAEIGKTLVGMVLYFVMITFLYFIAPKLRKITGHDKK